MVRQKKLKIWILVGIQLGYVKTAGTKSRGWSAPEERLQISQVEGLLSTEH